jgi:hypothetical protein
LGDPWRICAYLEERIVLLLIQETLGAAAYSLGGTWRSQRRSSRLQEIAIGAPNVPWIALEKHKLHLSPVTFHIH